MFTRQAKTAKRTGFTWKIGVALAFLAAAGLYGMIALREGTWRPDQLFSGFWAKRYQDELNRQVYKALGDGDLKYLRELVAEGADPLYTNIFR